MLDAIVLMLLTYCLTLFLKSIGLFKRKLYLPMSLCVGLALAFSYMGGEPASAMVMGIGSALCACLAYYGIKP